MARTYRTGDLTPAELNILLERFDQTNREMQRQIVGRFVRDREILVVVCENAIESLEAMAKAEEEQGVIPRGKDLAGLAKTIRQGLLDAEPARKGA